MYSKCVLYLYHIYICTRFLSLDSHLLLAQPMFDLWTCDLSVSLPGFKLPGGRSNQPLTGVLFFTMQKGWNLWVDACLKNSTLLLGAKQDPCQYMDLEKWRTENGSRECLLKWADDSRKNFVINNEVLWRGNDANTNQDSLHDELP